MRLVDADELAQGLMKISDRMDCTASRLAKSFAKLMQDDMFAPTIDAAPVVQCVECKRRDTDVCARNGVYCTEFGEFMPYDGFCHKGAKMDAEE